MAAADREAIGGDAFARLMEPLGPFEPAARIAAAVSGGLDSLALALLAAPWAAARGGSLTALVVDHGLGEGSQAAAGRAHAWLAARGVASAGLRWEGPKPETGIQAAARDARYRLLGAWCAANGVLHLLTAHHRDDQAETLLLRLAAGSGPDGLAAMAPVQETRWGRILRPLLGVGRPRLRATLEALGQDWLDDPANDNPIFARARLRRSAAALAREGMTPARLAATAGQAGAARAALEAGTAALLARSVSVFPAGYALADRAALAAAPADLSQRAVERILGCVGGRPYAPRRARLLRLLETLRGGAAFTPRTLGGCVIRPAGGAILFAREAAAIRETVPVAPDAEVFWDGRFRIRFAAGTGRAGAAGIAGQARLCALGTDGWRAVQAGLDRAPRLPDCARRALPAVRDDSGVVEAPHLGYRRAGVGPVLDRLAFAPTRPLAATEFSVV